jgi:hypothetical protein
LADLKLDAGSVASELDANKLASERAGDASTATAPTATPASGRCAPDVGISAARSASPTAAEIGYLRVDSHTVRHAFHSEWRTSGGNQPATG